MPEVRLDKYVSTAGNVSRSDARKMIFTGRVTVDGNVITDIGSKVSDDSIVLIDGREKTYDKYVYYMLNKPKGVLSASDDRNRETVVDIVKAECNRNGLFPVGRLDKDTTGLLIVTDDGDFGHKVISPKSHIEKEYVVTVDKPVTDEDIVSLEKGVTLSDGTVCRPAKVFLLSGDRKVLSVTITEGKYHEIKRMLGTVGAGVVDLHRKRIGGLVLDGKLAEGNCRKMTDMEVLFVQNH